MSMQAQFIAIEGIEGAGKSTAIQHIKNFLQTKGVEYIDVREPGGTEVAESIRNILKAHYNNELVFPETEVLLLYAARMQLVNTVIKPALANNTWVICDRHDLSTIAYQSGGRGLSEEFIYTIKQSVLQDFTYDICIYFDVEPSIGLERARSRGKLDRIEQESIDFFANIRNKYLELASKYDNIYTIDANKNEGQVKTDLIDLLTELYK